MPSAENHAAVRNAVNEGGILTRALFDAMGTGKDVYLTGAQLEMGVRELMKDGGPTNCVVIGVAKQVARGKHIED